MFCLQVRGCLSWTPRWASVTRRRRRRRRPLALAVAPLTVSGTVAASVMTGKFILILVRAIRVTTCFVYRRRRRRAPRARSPLASVVQRYSRGRFGNAHTEDEPARGGATQTDASATHVAFVGVASATALRVYPAFGVLKGERHTVKKGKFLFIFVWAIMMTSCFVYSDTGRTPRRRRARRAPRGG